MELANDERAVQYEVALLPWGGAAMRVDAAFAPATTVGKAFVFLPLPVSTGLPLHINGFFEVSENRRDIWYGDDMHGAGKFRSDWNLALIEDVIARSYADLLLAASQKVAPTDTTGRTAYYQVCIVFPHPLSVLVNAEGGGTAVIAFNALLTWCCAYNFHPDPTRALLTMQHRTLPALPGTS